MTPQQFHAQPVLQVAADLCLFTDIVSKDTKLDELDDLTRARIELATLKLTLGSLSHPDCNIATGDYLLRQLLDKYAPVEEVAAAVAQIVTAQAMQA